MLGLLTDCLPCVIDNLNDLLCFNSSLTNAKVFVKTLQHLFLLFFILIISKVCTIDFFLFKIPSTVAAYVLWLFKHFLAERLQAYGANYMLTFLQYEFTWYILLNFRECHKSLEIFKEILTCLLAKVATWKHKLNVYFKKSSWLPLKGMNFFIQ